jgi:O-antigen ligase
MLFYLSSAVLTAALVAGGGTHVGFFGDAAVQLLAIPLLCGALWPAFSREGPQRKAARLALWVCVVAAAISALQLCPLYLDYWFSSSGFFPESTGALSAPPRTHTLSLTPEASWAAALSLIVPLSVFAGAVQLGLSERIRLCFLLAGLGAVSLGLGFLQMAQGPASSLRFYEYTNLSEAVGFFANRNHFAALLNVTLVLAALWLWMTADAALRQSTFGSRSILWLAVAAAFLVADTAGLAMARSRAGIFLAIIALLGIVVMAYKQTWRTGSDRGLSASRISLAAALFAVLFAAQFGLGGMLSRFEGDPLEDLRLTLNRATFKTASEKLPFGTGLGSFVRVYAAVERKEDAFAGFANRAHNDSAELLLETGLPGAGLLLAFLAWYAWRSYGAWTEQRGPSSPLEPMLERAASLIIGLLLLHSIVDYPLRTAALGTVFSFFCAVLAAPATAVACKPQEREAPPQSRRRHQTPPMPPEKWGADAVWPESWQRKP